MKGSIQRRGDAWRLVIDAGVDPVTGRRRQTVRTVRGTKRDAQDTLNQLLAEAQQGRRRTGRSFRIPRGKRVVAGRHRV